MLSKVCLHNYCNSVLLPSLAKKNCSSLRCKLFKLNLQRIFAKSMCLLTQLLTKQQIFQVSNFKPSNFVKFTRHLRLATQKYLFQTSFYVKLFLHFIDLFEKTGNCWISKKQLWKRKFILRKNNYFFQLLSLTKREKVGERKSV